MATTALVLNRDEHRYEIRSSDYLLSYYVLSLVGCAFSLFILHGGDLSVLSMSPGHDLVPQTELDPPPVSQYKWDPLRHMLFFTGSIVLGFLFEAFPRTNTRVQQLSREKEELTSFDQANLFSRVTFHHVQHMMSLGAKRPLTAADIDERLPENLQTRPNFELISQTWEKRLARYNRRHRKGHGSGNVASSTAGPSLVLTVLDAYKWKIAPAMVTRLLGFGFWYVPTLFFSYLLKFFADYGEALKNGTPPPAIAQGLLIASGMFLANLVSAFSMSSSSQELSYLGIGARAALVDMIYRKALRLSPAARKASTLGEISNLMAVDAEVWMQATNFLPLSVTIPFELCIALFLLYRLLGWSLLAGLAIFAIVAPIQAKLAKFFQSFQKSKLKFMDSRVRAMTEILANIKIVKLYSWEGAFRRKIDDIRDRELGAQKSIATIRSFLVIVFSSVNLLIVLATYSVYSKWGGPGFTPAQMTPEVVFLGISLFTVMGRPLGLISLAISHIITLKTANRRIQKFLLLEEMDITVVQQYSRQSSSSKDPLKGVDGKILAVEIKNGTFVWEEEATALSPNSANAIATSTQEQEEWQPLLGTSSSASSSATPMRPALSSISLQIPDGNLTAIAGRIGQGKSSLLSAILGEMYKKQGTVKVYGDVAFVPQQAWIINATVRDNILLGKPFEQAKYDKIVFASGLVPDLEMLPSGSETEIGEKGINLSGGQKQRVALARAAYQDADIYLLDDPLSAVDAHVDQHLWKHLIGPEGLLKHKTRLLVTHGIHHLESFDQIVVIKDGMILETGEYGQLMRAKNAFYQLITEYSVQDKKKRKEDKKKDHTTTTDSATAAALADAKKPLTTIKKPHDVVVVDKKDKAAGGTLVHAEKMEVGKIGWKVYLDYAKAIMGRVVNRFSSDVSAVDSQLPEMLAGFLNFAATVLGIFVVISYSTPMFLIAAPPLLLVFLLIQDYYIKSSGSLKRLLSVARSPLYQHFSESLTGVSIIRSTNGLATQFVDENEKRSDVIALRTDKFVITSRWLNIRVQTLCAITVFLTAAFAVLNVERLDPSLVGMALSYALNLTNVISIMVRTVSDVQNQFVSVERIQEYLRLPIEAPLQTGVRVPERWPQQGKVVFKDFSARYREGLELCIRDASFTIEPQQKVGIVGRTGAGKSSLTLALFRIIEAADSFWAMASDPSAIDHPIDSDAFSTALRQSGGSIEIDGIDISTLGLRVLRQHLSIIPQDPTLFAGTVRYNLDPFNELEDAELWQALERAHLKDHISSLSGGLSFEVAQNGENFSVGQRSLICLARALLRKTKVLVLDEATAAVDVETDDLIQKTIRKEFKDRTILTIAHRIKTVMDSDKILVLENGRVQEFEAPKVLLKQRESLFYSLAHQAGEI
ncbi:hypothetical protein BGX28_006877 [Mortierella sp. GBA30]|nr:hypothetical protein BGX28_006877 [Mortierella sp. GBA30]